MPLLESLSVPKMTSRTTSVDQDILLKFVQFDKESKSGTGIIPGDIVVSISVSGPDSDNNLLISFNYAQDYNKEAWVVVNQCKYPKIIVGKHSKRIVALVGKMCDSPEQTIAGFVCLVYYMKKREERLHKGRMRWGINIQYENCRRILNAHRKDIHLTEDEKMVKDILT